MRELICRSLLPGLVVLALSLCAGAAARVQVLVVVEQERDAAQELIAALRATLEQRAGAGSAQLSVVDLTRVNATTLANGSAARAQLIVPVGTRATQHIASLEPAAPVLSVLTPRQSFDAIARERNRAPGSEPAFSAIYLEPRAAQQLELVRRLLPAAERVAVVLGPSTAHYGAELQAAAQARGLTLLMRTVTAEDNLVKVLDQLLPEADVMLAVVDPLVFNRRNAQGVLLTAYRYRVPLIGASPAYVKAGAIAAVHASAAQIGQQLGETIASLANGALRTLPPPQHPKYVSVAVNEQVARSLAVPIADVRRIETQLEAAR